MYKKSVIFIFLFVINSSPVFGVEKSTCENAILSLISNDLYKTVDEYYLKHDEITGVQTWKGKVIHLEMTNELSFEITIEVDTFISAHNTIGTDRITFNRDIENGLELVSYQHTPSTYKEEILKRFKNQPERD